MDTPASIQSATSGLPQGSDLADFTSAYSQRLIAMGYSQGTVHAYTACVSHFVAWNNRRRRAASAICPKDITRFLDHHLPRCKCGPRAPRCHHQVRAALRHLVALLRDAGILVEPRISDPVDSELDSFDEYMRQTRGLARNTRNQRVLILRRFLKDVAGSKCVQLPGLRPEDLRTFIDWMLQRWSPSSAQVLAGTLRSYIRYRAWCGDEVKHLFPVIVSPAHWRLAPLPQTLSPAEIAHLAKPFPADIPSVRRAFAMVRCVVDVGLRASEVVGLALDDVDWVAGTIRIAQGKSRRADILPLPQQTARAIAEYLRFERPRCDSRRVFVRHVAPVEEPVGPGVVRRAVREAYRRCGMSHTRVHILRHTLAKRLLDSGSTLKNVADVLRHRSLDTTLIYAKVDTPSLSAVAMPWPGSAT
jgi:site-specific recombinase XerD